MNSKDVLVVYDSYKTKQEKILKLNRKCQEIFRSIREGKVENMAQQQNAPTTKAVSANL